jgi:hypothetical protein
MIVVAYDLPVGPELPARLRRMSIRLANARPIPGTST